MSTKYIVNNLSGQTITGNITINGNLFVTGSSTTSLSSYKALLTQTGSLTGTSINNFNFELILGETYTIADYVLGDDFSNVAYVISGNINETGCVFTATGPTPINWSNSSTLVSNGDLVVDVLENTLGFGLDWSWKPFGGYGYYVAVNDITGPITNSFLRPYVSMITQPTPPFIFGPPNLIANFLGIYDVMNLDDVIILNVFDFSITDSVDDRLYYTPVQIEIQKGPEIIVSGTVSPSFPFYNPSVNLKCDDSNIYYFYGGGLVNNMDELLASLNTDTETSYLGTYTDDGSGGLLLSTTTYNKKQFCPTDTLSFDVFSD